MMMKQLKRILAAFLLIAVCVPAIASCEKKPEKMILVTGAGSALYLNGADTSATYRIKELNATSEGNTFYLPEYVYDQANGTSYSVLNEKGKVIATVPLSKKSAVYTGGSLHIVLEENPDPLLYIPGDISYVVIESSDASHQYNLHIEIGKRETPLDLTLRNANLQTAQCIPVILNCFNSDINILTEGTNRIAAGTELPTEEEYAEIKKLMEEFSEISDELWLEKIAWKVISGHPYLACALTIKAVAQGKVTGSMVTDTFSRSFLDNCMAYTDAMTDHINRLFGYVSDVIQGSKGQDGLAGSDAIQSMGGISFYGSGSIDICGGNGCPGGDAIGTPLSTRVYGGNGGDAGRAIYCRTCLSLMQDGFLARAGVPGEGGKGISNSLTATYCDGQTGKAVAIEALYTYVKKKS